MKFNLLSLISASLLLFVFGCDNKKARNETVSTVPSQQEESEIQKEVETTVKNVQAVCVWNNISLRETPDPKGKYITSISLGEKVIFLGEESDGPEKDKTYYKIKLADEKTGWSRSDFIIPESEPAVFISDASVYNRPDLLTKKDGKFSATDIVAMVDQKDGWVEIKGKRTDGKWITSAWTKKESLSSDPTDIALAKFLSEAIAKEGDEKIEALQELANNQDLKSSVFYGRINTTLSVLEKKAITVKQIDSTSTLVKDSLQKL